MFSHIVCGFWLIPVRPNRTYLVTELDPDPRSPVDLTLEMSTIVVVHPADIALVVMVTVTEALLAEVATMRTIVVDIVPLQELEAPLMITRPHVVDSRILTVGTTHLTHT